MDVAYRVTAEERRWALLWAAGIVGLTALPYLIAWQLAPAETQYTGLLVNHFDGESYYAKMQQGARGDWLFHLPFTPEPHDGAFLLTFYLALGHLAAWWHLPIPITYHLARLAAGFFFLQMAYSFIALFFERTVTRRAAFLLLSFSSGLGWLLAPFGITLSDLWVAEGFTFLSLLVNPHFPLAMGIMLGIFCRVLGATGPAPSPKPAIGQTWLAPSRLPGSVALGLTLALVQPLAVPVVLAVGAVYLALVARQARAWPWKGIVEMGVATAGASPVMLYDLYISRANPALAAWSVQNLTPSPPPWDLALSYGLVLLLALPGLWLALRRRRPADLLLLGWVGSVAALLYAPFPLQRRFLTGLHIPVALLAALALERLIWPRFSPRRRSLFTAGLIALTALTNLFVPLIAVLGVARGASPLVMSAEVAGACRWLHDHTAWTDTVLAPADLGQFIPAWAGNRVVYGHPFETIDAEIKKAEVLRFYGPEATVTERRAVLDRYGVRYLLWPAAASDLDPAALDLTPAWAGEELILYHVGVRP